MSAATEAIELIDRYLQHCEDRELAEAADLWGALPMHIEFPGPVVFGSLDELVEDSRGRYAWVRKHRDEYAAAEAPEGTTVTSIGRLYGENLQGVAFEDIRYVDVFTVVDGRIFAQRVWNDLAVSGVLERG